MNREELLEELGEQEVTGSSKNWGFPLPGSSKELKGIKTKKDVGRIKGDLEATARGSTLIRFAQWLTGLNEVMSIKSDNIPGAKITGWQIEGVVGNFASEPKARKGLEVLQEWGRELARVAGGRSGEPGLVDAKIVDDSEKPDGGSADSSGGSALQESSPIDDARGRQPRVQENLMDP